MRHIREAGGSFESDEAFFTGELALPPIEHTFAARRRAHRDGYFSVADLARGLRLILAAPQLVPLARRAAVPAPQPQRHALRVGTTR